MAVAGSKFVMNVHHPGRSDLVSGEGVAEITVPLHQLATAEPLLVDFPHPAHPPGAVAGKEGVLHLDQPDVEAGGVERLQEVPGQDVAGPGHEERMDRLEGQSGTSCWSSSWQRLVGTGRVVLHTARDELLAGGELRSEIIQQAADIDVHVVICLEDKPGGLTVLPRPLDPCECLESEVLVGVQEVLPHDVPVLSRLLTEL